MDTTLPLPEREEFAIAAMTALSGEIRIAPRRIALLTGGHRHGPITRLVSPSDVGELIKPFVFLGDPSHRSSASRGGTCLMHTGARSQQ